jgi:hypothetical protein
MTKIPLDINAIRCQPMDVGSRRTQAILARRCPAIGLSIPLIMSMEHLETVLQGDHDIDEHFRQAPFDPVKRRRAANRGTR